MLSYCLKCGGKEYKRWYLGYKNIVKYKYKTHIVKCKTHKFCSTEHKWDRIPMKEVFMLEVRFWLNFQGVVRMTRKEENDNSWCQNCHSI